MRVPELTPLWDLHFVPFRTEHTVAALVRLRGDVVTE